MLTFTDLPQLILDVHQQSQDLARSISPQLTDVGEKNEVHVGDDLLSRKASSYVYVDDGVFKFFHEDKLVRLYTEGDLILLKSTSMLEGCRIEATFGATVTFIDKPTLMKKFESDVALQLKWFELAELEIILMHLLCSHYLNEDIQPNVQFRQFKSGEVMIREGEVTEFIHELVEGEATVNVSGTTVGVVKANEFFGEISFLADKPCNATVTATTDCLIHLIPRTEFEKLIQARPHVMVELARTLARRVTSLDAKLARSHDA